MRCSLIVFTVFQQLNGNIFTHITIRPSYL
nr:MAG TPA: hypothetical protein [Caudoviricetes sp.]DAH29749.1 MAG TPA: hypothetical protein [Caudoviricetes sp.]DAV73745.1 MAG TPA: hypothetical protein [Bacteriophage sp.]DAZ23788.1 MAG TPA: hypothetical protein [Caudoviricetes sp.]